MRDLVRGIGASAGRISGTVKVVLNLEDAISKIHDGDILVTVMTDPDLVPFLMKSAAVVTNTGGMLCHAAIVAREMGKPCVVGTKNATQVLTDGMRVIVDGSIGIVCEE